jgi:hypothetical protein
MQEIGCMCYKTKCDMVEDGLMERASDGREANSTLSCNSDNVGRNG